MAPRANDRGQTAIDFVVGVALFLLAVAFVLAFVPSMFAPFFAVDGANAQIADRAAGTLVDSLLDREDGHSGELDNQTVHQFFAEDCPTDEPGEWLSDQLDLRTENLQVSISGIDGSPCGETPEGAETTSTRIVTIDGDIHRLRVVVW